MSYADPIERAVDASERVAAEFPDLRFCIVGGVATDAILSPGTTINPYEEHVTTTLNTLSAVRTNGTRRDIDIVTLTPDEGIRKSVARLVREKLGECMVVSVFRQFGPDENVSLIRRRRSLNRLRSNGTSALEVGPLSARVPDIAVSNWKLVLPHDRGNLPIYHPLFHAQNYSVRSLGGPREKDVSQDKLPALYAKLTGVQGLRTPEVNAEFAELSDMCNTLYKIRELGVYQAYRQYGSVALLSKALFNVEKSQRFAYIAHLGEQLKSSLSIT